MNTKVKYLSGNKKDSVVELDEVKAKSLIEDGLAEAVVEEDAMSASLKAFEVKGKEVMERILVDASAKAVDRFSKGINKATNSISVGPDRELEDRSGGFQSLSHFMYEVKRSGIGMSNPTPSILKHMTNEARRMKTAGATPEVSEGSPLSLTAGTTDGAIIPVQYSEAIFQMYGEQDDLMGMAFPFAMNSLSAHLPILRNYDRSNTTAANGVVVAESGEGNLITLSKTNWEQKLFTLVKEAVMVPVSNEALDDNNVGVANAIAAQAIWQLRKQINGGIVQGFTTSCVGIIGHAATKLVGRQVNTQISFTDLINMYAAFAHQDANYAGAVWLCHPTVLAQLGTTTVGNFPAFLAPGAGQQNEGRPLSILGRPVVVTGWCKALGTSGDLLLIDPKKYIMGYKGGVNSFVSPHVYAASDQTGFRFTQRVNGQLGLTGLITLEDGSTKVSPFVELGQVGGLS